MRIAIIAGDKRGKSGVPVYAQAASVVSGKLNSTADGFPSISSYIDAYKNAQLYDKVLLMDEAVLSEQDLYRLRDFLNTESPDTVMIYIISSTTDSSKVDLYNKLFNVSKYVVANRVDPSNRLSVAELVSLSAESIEDVRRRNRKLNSTGIAIDDGEVDPFSLPSPSGAATATSDAGGVGFGVTDEDEGSVTGFFDEEEAEPEPAEGSDGPVDFSAFRGESGFTPTAEPEPQPASAQGFASEPQPVTGTTSTTRSVSESQDFVSEAPEYPQSPQPAAGVPEYTPVSESPAPAYTQAPTRSEEPAYPVTEPSVPVSEAPSYTPPQQTPVQEPSVPASEAPSYTPPQQATTPGIPPREEEYAPQPAREEFDDPFPRVPCELVLPESNIMLMFSPTHSEAADLVARKLAMFACQSNKLCLVVDMESNHTILNAVKDKVDINARNPIWKFDGQAGGYQSESGTVYLSRGAGSTLTEDDILAIQGNMENWLQAADLVILLLSIDNVRFYEDTLRKHAGDPNQYYPGGINPQVVLVSEATKQGIQESLVKLTGRDYVGDDVAMFYEMCGRTAWAGNGYADEVKPIPKGVLYDRTEWYAK